LPKLNPVHSSYPTNSAQFYSCTVQNAELRFIIWSPFVRGKYRSTECTGFTFRPIKHDNKNYRL